MGKRSLRRVLGLSGRMVGDGFHLYHKWSIRCFSCGICDTNDPYVRGSRSRTENWNDFNFHSYQPDGIERSRKG